MAWCYPKQGNTLAYIYCNAAYCDIDQSNPHNQEIGPTDFMTSLRHDIARFVLEAQNDKTESRADGSQKADQDEENYELVVIRTLRPPRYLGVYGDMTCYADSGTREAELG